MADAREVLVAIDGSEASRRVADFVNRFFDGMGMTITAINVGEVPVAWDASMAEPGTAYAWPHLVPTSDAVASTTDLRVDDPRDGEWTVPSDLRASNQVVEVGADVADTIRLVATERGADLIVVGSSHKGALARLLDPSVSADLAKSAPVPVLVVH